MTPSANPLSNGFPLINHFNNPSQFIPLENYADTDPKFFGGSVHSSPISPASSEEPIVFQTLSASSYSEQQNLLPLTSSSCVQTPIFYAQNQMLPSTSTYDTYAMPNSPPTAQNVTYNNNILTQTVIINLKRNFLTYFIIFIILESK